MKNITFWIYYLYVAAGLFIFGRYAWRWIRKNGGWHKSIEEAQARMKDKSRSRPFGGRIDSDVRTTGMHFFILWLSVVVICILISIYNTWFNPDNPAHYLFRK